MPIDVEEYTKLKRQAEKAKQDQDRAQGALDQLLRRLKTEHDCDDLDEAEALIVDLQKKQVEITQQYDGKMAAFREKWDGTLRKSADHLPTAQTKW